MIDLNDVRPIGLLMRTPGPSMAEVADELNERIPDLARELYGEPNRVLSTQSQLRYGRKGSVAIELDGPKRGQWYDHESGVGGDGLNLVSHVLGLANGSAYEWAVEWLGLEASPPARAFAAREISLTASSGPDLNWTLVTADRTVVTSDAAGIGQAPVLDRTDGTSDRTGVPSPPRVDHERAAKVARIVRECQDPAGTVVDLYLANRGITARPLPPAIRYRPRAYGQYGALVALATDAGGTVTAVQQVYLTSDGQKAPLEVPKRTNKARDDWADTSAVRLPGEPPLILCEGPETALSVWQATGRETWACLGAANVAHAPVPAGASVVVARDGDQPGSSADKAVLKALGVLRARGQRVAVVQPPPGTDFNDLLVNQGEGAVRARIRGAIDGDLVATEWRSGLLCTDEGMPRPILANVLHALRNAPEWRGVLWHNEFATTTVARRPPPWAANEGGWQDRPWSDGYDALAAEWLQHQGILVPTTVAGQAVETVARARVFHPVREYLDGLRWDGVPRLDTWLIDHLGAADTEYIRAVGPRWLISAVARIYEPGCKADCALILEGPQGIKKSSALRVIAEPWFADRLSELGDKDSALETKGVWIIELAELDSLSRSDVSAIKAFMSRTHDRFRPPYGKRLVDLPRQCVFAGSINPEGGYLKDATGGRRFWPVECGDIKLDRLGHDRDQLWGEARDRFHKGTTWWLETPALNALAAEEQADRYQGDAWETLIREYLDNHIEWTDGLNGRRRLVRPREQGLTVISMGEILETALDMPRARWTPTDQSRVSRCLVSMGFKRTRPRTKEGGRAYVYKLLGGDQ